MRVGGTRPETVKQQEGSIRRRRVTLSRKLTAPCNAEQSVGVAEGFGDKVLHHRRWLAMHADICLDPVIDAPKHLARASLSLSNAALAEPKRNQAKLHDHPEGGGGGKRRSEVR